MTEALSPTEKAIRERARYLEDEQLRHHYALLKIQERFRQEFVRATMKELKIGMEQRRPTIIKTKWGVLFA